MQKEIQDAIDEFYSANEEYGTRVKNYLIEEEVNTIESLEELFAEVTGDRYFDVTPKEAIDQIMFTEDYARFH